jgi:GMP reductase
MQLETDVKIDFRDVLIKPKRSTLCSRNEVDLTRNFKFKNSQCDYTGIPIIAANMDTIGTFRMASALNKHNLSTAIHKHYTEDQLIEFFGRDDNANKHWYSMGITDHDWEKFKKVSKVTGITCLCVDVANGYQEVFVDFIKKIRSYDEHATIMAGNVVTSEMTEALILAGADIVKVGIGPGSVCTTRKQTGVGMPQLSAIIECADAAHGLGGHICSDGGITCPGDLGKAFGAGADFVMMGGAFAGHDECDGEIIYEEHLEERGLGVLDEDPEIASKQVHSVMVPIKYPVKMKFYGMSSKEAMEKHSGGVAKHRAAEGKCVEVDYKGPVENTILEYLGGLRSTCTYTGSQKLKELSKRTTFVRVEHQINEVFNEK